MPPSDGASPPTDSAASTPRVPRWTSVQRRLHWLVAAGVGLQFLLQAPMRRAFEAIGADAPVGATAFVVTTVHTWTGVTLGLMLAWRLALRRSRARERTGAADASGDPREKGGRLRRGVAAANHALLYLVTGTMVASGALQWYAGVDAATAWHRNAKYALVALVTLHVAAALWHALVRRDDVLSAMTARSAPEGAARLDR